MPLLFQSIDLIGHLSIKIGQLNYPNMAGEKEFISAVKAVSVTIQQTYSSLTYSSIAKL